jgi:hypothetical protein
MTPTTLLTTDGGINTPPASQMEEFLDWFSQQGSVERGMVINALRIVQRYAPPRDAQVAPRPDHQCSACGGSTKYQNVLANGDHARTEECVSAARDSAPRRRRSSSEAKTDTVAAPGAAPAPAPASEPFPSPSPVVVAPVPSQPVEAVAIQPERLPPPAPAVILPWYTREEMVAAFKVELKRVGDVAFNATLKKHDVMFGQLAIDQRAVDILAEMQKLPKELF